MLLPYCTGIRRCASLNITISAMINTPMITKKPIPSTLSRSRNPCASSPGNPATIPANMISEIPFPIPFSVINSPSHTRNMVPATSENKAASVGSSASPVNPTENSTTPSGLVNTPLCSNRINCPYPWASAIGTVSRWT